MNRPSIIPSDSPVDFARGALQGKPIVRSQKRVIDLAGVFADDSARTRFSPDALAYTVEAHFPVSEGTEAGLFFGVSILEPGVVGEEYMMTRGHFHAKSNRGEYYWGIAGSGLLILMDRDRTARAEIVKPNSLHYIPGDTAHRLVNIGKDQLRVGACWPSDAGHDYDTIATHGFSVRVFCRQGKPVIEQVG